MSAGTAMAMMLGAVAPSGVVGFCPSMLRPAQRALVSEHQCSHAKASTISRLSMMKDMRRVSPEVQLLDKLVKEAERAAHLRVTEPAPVDPLHSDDMDDVEFTYVPPGSVEESSQTAVASSQVGFKFIEEPSGADTLLEPIVPETPPRNIDAAERWARSLKTTLSEAVIKLGDRQKTSVKWGSWGAVPAVRAAGSFQSQVAEKSAAIQAPATAFGPPRISTAVVPNLWLPIAHSNGLKKMGKMKVVIDGKPVAVWRDSTGDVHAISDVCIHRGASLSDGWTQGDRLVCPYHGFEYEGDGTLAHMPGVTGPKSAAKAGCGGRKAPAYLVTERNGWIYLFPDPSRAGAVEQYAPPFVLPEAVSPDFRSVEGTVEINGHVDACMENMLDLLHISYVHTFGNMQNPVPFEVTYEPSYDDPGSNALASNVVTFRYKAGSRAFSKVIGGSDEVVVRNEFHLPYTAVIRVFFGVNQVKTIMATAVPNGDNKTTLHWKLYRNFAMTHAKDQGPLNWVGDKLFEVMMKKTLQEDKDIIHSIYPEFQRGFMNAKFDKQVLLWRKALENFMTISQSRTATQVESSLQMDLISRVSRTQRGIKSSAQEHLAIGNIIASLEQIYTQSVQALGTGENHAQLPAPAMNADLLEGAWTLEYMGQASTAADGSWLPVGPSGMLNPEERAAALAQAGSESLLMDFKETGRPLWADTEKSEQIIDFKNNKLINRAIYKGWSGLTTTVQLDAIIKPLEGFANRMLVEFKRAVVDVGGIRVAFPHLGRFSPAGWLETTYINEHIRIARGNKGSVFVLTRQPLAESKLFNDEE